LAANTWEALARSDPLWAVLSEPDKRARAWDVEAFFETGEELVERILRRAESAGSPIGRGSAIDFGCGVGRISRALARRFDKVVGVDISPTMINIARELNKDFPGLSFLLNEYDDLRMLQDAHGDLVCSHITLQHLRPALAERYIVELFRLVRPKAHAYFQMPSHLMPGGVDAPLPTEACYADIVIHSAPDRLAPGASAPLDVEIRNATSIAWLPRLSVGNHWRTVDGAVVRYDDGRTVLPPLDGGEAARVVLTVAAPVEPGSYRLEVDIVQEGVRWFSDLGRPTRSVPVRVDGAAAQAGAAPLPAAIADNIEPVYQPAPSFEMHGIPRSRIEAIAAQCGMRLVRCDDHVTDWLSHEYIFTKLPK
jgi:SAM-dependent methyltransferase